MLPDYMMERQNPDKKLFVTANTSTTVGLHKRYIFAPAGDSGDVTTVVLPNVSEAEGRKLTVQFFGAAGTGGRVVVDYTNGTASGNTTGINTTDVDVEFESNGIEWTLTRAE